MKIRMFITLYFMPSIIASIFLGMGIGDYLELPSINLILFPLLVLIITLPTLYMEKKYEMLFDKIDEMTERYGSIENWINSV